EAERTADYWIFGGIFRPVYLEAFPAASLERFAIDAKADGSLNVDVFLRGLTDKADVVARVLDDALAPVGAPLTVAAAAGATQLKSLNANAVRASHYPPDRYFLDAADRLGLYVLDELAGWHAPTYDTGVGRKLIEEMVTFDVNHPSIVFWDNGNEGGW